jgi:phage tail sheath protein FI
MAEKLVSPGVFTRENDLSFIAQGVGAIGGAIVGPFKQGPAFKPTIITSPSELEEIFGAADGTYYTELTAQNYLRETGLVTICRVAGTEGYTDTDAVYLLAATSGSGSKIVGTLFGTETPLDFEAFSSATNGNFVLNGYSASVVASSTASIDDVFGVSALGTKGAYAHTFFKNHGLVINSTTTITALNQSQDFSFEATTALTPMIQSQLISGERYDLFQFETLADGNVENKRFKVSIGNIKAAGDINGSDYGTFNVFVRAYDDTDKRQTVLEQYNNVSLNPSATNYIARVIGDTKSEIDSDGKITTLGDWANKSKYIRVKMATASDSNPVVAVPFGHEAYTIPFQTDGDDNLVPVVTYTTGSKDSSTKFSGIDLEGNSDNSFYLNAIPNGTGLGNNVAFGLDTQVALSLTSNAAATELSKRQFTVAFQGGFDGVNPTTPINKGAAISNTNVQGFDLSTSAAAGTMGYKKCLNALSNTDEWDINLLVLPGVNHNDHSAVTQYAMDICENRADTFYIMDPAGQAASIGDVTAVAESLDTNYAAVYYPWLKTIDTNTGKLITVPPSVLLPRVYAANDATAAEWFAPAGLNRGGVIGAAAVLNRLTHAERDELYEAKVNPIAQFPGQGISAFGQKTLQSRPSALDRINVRRLLITVKKYIASTSRFLIFEQNTTDTRNKFLNTVNPYLESIQQRQGLYAFRVVMDDTNNTPDVIDRNILKGAIFLQPTKTAEFIQIDFNVLPTGASFNA